MRQIETSGPFAGKQLKRKAFTEKGPTNETTFLRERQRQSVTVRLTSEPKNRFDDPFDAVVEGTDKPVELTATERLSAYRMLGKDAPGDLLRRVEMHEHIKKVRTPKQ